MEKYSAIQLQGFKQMILVGMDKSSVVDKIKANNYVSIKCIHGDFHHFERSMVKNVYEAIKDGDNAYSIDLGSEANADVC